MKAPERDLLLLLALTMRDVLTEINGSDPVFKVHAEMIDSALRHFKKTAQRGNKK